MSAEPKVLGGTRLHTRDKCDGAPCALHSPSDHPLADRPLLWRNERGLLERICEHGVGHPDPDHLARLRRNGLARIADMMGVHGCDGCCSASLLSATQQEEK